MEELRYYLTSEERFNEFKRLWRYPKEAEKLDRKLKREERKKKEKQKKLDTVYLKFPEEMKLDTKDIGIDTYANEIFSVTDYPEYFISTHGRIIQKNDKGYSLTDSVEDEDGRAFIPVKEEMIYVDDLVAKTFLLPIKRSYRVWHIDGNIKNNYHGNLMYVNSMSYGKLVKGTMRIESILYQQGRYVPTNELTSRAYSIYHGILMRCGSKEPYLDATVCDEWRNNELKFIAWYMDNYYSCDGESMAVDKDLLVPGNKEYAPNKCVLLPRTLNTMLSNCKKHNLNGKSTKYPLGVKYDERLNMYYGQITTFGGQETIHLNYWDTPEEAFEEYRQYKLKDIRRMAELYRGSVPEKVYEALLKVDIKPY